jgi:hypothetical protein
VAFDGNPGRGYRKNRPDDYPLYMLGCDIVSFDLYAYSFRNPAVQEKIWLVPYGVDNLYRWSQGRRIVWNFVEATQVYRGGKKPTPEITRAEVWMSIIHGTRGIIYYAHGQGSAGDNTESALVTDKEMMAAVKQINAQVHRLAAVINSPTVANGATVRTSDPNAPVDLIVKRYGGATYVFAAGMRPATTTAAFTVKGLPARAPVEVIDEARTIDSADGEFSDDFGPFGVHLYKISTAW